MTLALAPPTAPSVRWLTPEGALVVAAMAALAAVMLFHPAMLGDGDTYWHLGAGAWMLDHLQVPHVDPFSHTRGGAPWTAHEWLSEVVMALAYRVGGWSGLVVLFAAAVGGTAALLTARLSRHIGGTALAAVVILAFAMGGGSLLARPHVLVLPLILLWALEMLDARDQDRAPRLAFAGLMVLWANLHGSYVFGFVLLAPFALEALLAAEAGGRWRVVRDWGVFGVVTLIGTMLTPHGPAGLLYPFYIMTLDATSQITEWRPTDVTVVSPFPVALGLTLYVAVRRGLTLPVVRLLLLLLLLVMALQHARHLLVLGLVAPLLLAEPLGRALGKAPSGTPVLDRRIVAALAIVFAALTLVRFAVPLQRDDGPTTPATAVAAVPAALAARPVLNEYGYGGYLIHRGLRPYIDGRADMYGDPFFKAYLKAVSGDAAALDRALSAYDVAWTLFPVESRVVKRMDARAGWRRLHADDTAVVHVRVDAEPVLP